MNQDFFEKYKPEIVRTINVFMVLFALIIGFNIGSGSTQQLITKLQDRINELEDFIEIDESAHKKEILEQHANCEIAKEALRTQNLTCLKDLTELTNGHCKVK